jgi:hypothetical protein
MSTIEEIRKIRIGPYAAFDTISTIVIFYFLSKRCNINPLIYSGGFVLGIITHRIFKVDTPMTRQLFENDLKE